jgi:hypothetical protein
MGERRFVALLKELPSLIGVCVFYKHFTATRFFPTDSSGLDHFHWFVPKARKNLTLGLTLIVLRSLVNVHDRCLNTQTLGTS